MENKVKTYTIVATGVNVSWTIVDKETGEKKEGTTHYVVCTENRNGIPCRVKLFKATELFLGCCTPGDVVSCLYFDEYGRLVGCGD